MKFILTLYLCSATFGNCLPIPGYPQEKESFVKCIRDGLKDAQTHLFSEDGIKEQEIEQYRFYVSYTCLKPKTKTT
tara:strand:- start:184 stop:411 length:228 start_codon:yes stop_codon:yes gene_type:complete